MQQCHSMYTEINILYPFLLALALYIWITALVRNQLLEILMWELLVQLQLRGHTY